MEIKLATIRCENCERESYIGSWKVGINSNDELVRLCPECNIEVVVE